MSISFLRSSENFCSQVFGLLRKTTFWCVCTHMSLSGRARINFTIFTSFFYAHDLREKIIITYYNDVIMAKQLARFNLWSSFPFILACKTVVLPIKFFITSVFLPLFCKHTAAAQCVLNECRIEKKIPSHINSKVRLVIFLARRSNRKND